MKTLISEKNNPHMEKVHRVHYSKTDNNQLYQPCTDKKGIHCEGNQFGYVVDWQITEKKREAILVK